MKDLSFSSRMSTWRTGPDSVLADIGYALLPISIVVGAISFSVDVIVLGQTVALGFLILAHGLRIANKQPISLEFWQLQLIIFLIGTSYLIYHLPEGKYTFISLLNAALIISLFTTRSLPRVSEPLLYIFLLVVYGRLIAGYPTLDFVMLHSKNYLFIYSMFFVTAASIERYSHAKSLPIFAMFCTAVVGAVTLGLANILTSGLLLLYGAWCTRGVSRGLFLFVFALLVLFQFDFSGYRIFNNPPEEIMSMRLEDERIKRLGRYTDFTRYRDRIAGYHISDVEGSSNLLDETMRRPLGDERIEIWRSYLERLGPREMLLGGFAPGVDVSESLHSSVFAVHQKFGLVGFGFVLLIFILYFRNGVLGVGVGGILLIFLFRGLFDSIAFVGGYFDFALIGAAVSALRLRRQEGPQGANKSVFES